MTAKLKYKINANVNLTNLKRKLLVTCIDRNNRKRFLKLSLTL